MTKAQEKAIAELPQTGFHFSEEGHLYILDGKPLTGVTTILGVIAKPALIQWAADETAKYLGWYNEKYATTEEQENALVRRMEVLKSDPKNFFELLSEARVQHAKRKKDAGTAGTDVHALIEALVKQAIEQTNGVIPANIVAENSQVQNFINWAVQNNITFLESEKKMYSCEYWYAGTCDLVFLKEGKKYIGDIKTSSGIYGREFFFQMAGYQIALEENGEKDIHASTIIRCGKDGNFEIKDSFDVESDKAGFLAALSLYREINK